MTEAGLFTPLYAKGATDISAGKSGVPESSKVPLNTWKAAVSIDSRLAKLVKVITESRLWMPINVEVGN